MRKIDFNFSFTQKHLIQAQFKLNGNVLFQFLAWFKHRKSSGGIELKTKMMLTLKTKANGWF